MGTLYTTEQLEDQIKVALGGRISEEIFFNRVTTGASDDFKKCAQYAHGMVTEYGMSPALGPINYAGDENGISKPYEEETLSLPQIVEVLGPRPFAMKDSLKDYLQELKDRTDQTEELLEKEKEQEEAHNKEMRAAIKFDADAVEDDEDEKDSKTDAESSKKDTEGDKKEDEKKDDNDKKDK